MKKVLVSAVMSILLIIGSIFMVSMSPPYNATQCKSDCEFLVSIGLFSSNGQCRSACSTCTNPSNGATGAVCLCKLIDAEVGVDKFGQCVNAFK